MPKTLAFCPRNRAKPSSAQRGFTLLELLVVLALVALIAGLVAPVANNALLAARERAVLAELHALLEGLPLRSLRARAAQSYTGETLHQLLVDMPSGWSVDAATPLLCTDTGVASGGTVRLIAPGRPVRMLRVSPISGQVQDPSALP